MKYIFTFIVTLFYSTLSYSETPFSANDLSILFPLKDSSSMKYDISISSSSWGVVSSDAFTQVINTAELQNVFLNSKLKDPKIWKLVALRYTPCNHLAGEILDCSEQIRFVYQPMSALIDNYGLDDYAIHVIYEFGRSKEAEITTRLNSFRELKNSFSSNLNKPLQVHPILSSISGDAYVNSLKVKVIDRHINNLNPTKITFMGLKKTKLQNGKFEANHDEWVFFSGDIDNKGSWFITLLPTSAIHKSQILTADPESEEGIFSSIKRPISKFSLFGKNNIMENAVDILNPLKSNDHNVDCASCHIADRYVFPPLIENGNNLLDQITWMVKDQNRLTEVLIDNSIHVGRRGSEFPIPRVFGYMDIRAAISQRVVMDTALATKQANQLYSLKEDLLCSSNSNDNVMLCLYIDNTDLTTCLEKYCY